MLKNYKLVPENISPLYVIIAALFVCFLMIANISANRMVELPWGIIVTGDIFLFPLTYIFGDVLTEVYGFKRSRLVIWLGMGANILMITYFSFLIKMPFPSDFVSNSAFQTVLGSTPIIVLASIAAFFAGEFANSAALSIIKKLTKGRFLWIRTIGSTIIGQIFDTLTFMLIAFSFLPAEIFWQMVIVQYLFKLIYEIAATPLTYAIIRKIKKVEQLDTFDYGVKYNPFSLKIK